jgi:cyclophilin family peptidyl-prolyl cis-trans isomerase
MSRRAPLLFAAVAAFALAGCPLSNTAVGDLSLRPMTPGPNASAVAQASAGPSAAPSARPSARPSGAASARPSARPSAAGTPQPRPTDGAPVGGEIAAQSRFAGKTVTPKGRVAIETSKGTFVVALFPDQAPKAVAKFLSGVTTGVYDGTTFHRVLPNFVAQGGDPNSKTMPAGDPRIGSGGEGENVPGDFENGLAHLPGAVAFARSGDPNSSQTQFYVCLARQGSLDNNYLVFGQVVAGFDNVLKLTMTNVAGVTPDRIIRATVDAE